MIVLYIRYSFWIRDNLYLTCQSVIVGLIVFYNTIDISINLFIYLSKYKNANYITLFLLRKSGPSLLQLQFHFNFPFSNLS